MICMSRLGCILRFDVSTPRYDSMRGCRPCIMLFQPWLYIYVPGPYMIGLWIDGNKHFEVIYLLLVREF